MFKIITTKQHAATIEKQHLAESLIKSQAEQISRLRNLVTEQILDLEKLSGENQALHQEYGRIQELSSEVSKNLEKHQQKNIALEQLADCNKAKIIELTIENERMQELMPTIQSVLETMNKYKTIAINNRMMLDYKYYGNRLGKFAIYNQLPLYEKWHSEKLAELEADCENAI